MGLWGGAETSPCPTPDSPEDSILYTVSRRQLTALLEPTKMSASLIGHSTVELNAGPYVPGLYLRSDLHSGCGSYRDGSVREIARGALDQHLGKGFRGAHLVGDLAAVAARVCRACGLQAQQLVPGNSLLRENATHTAPLIGEWGCAVSQALQLNQFPWLH